MGCHFVATHQPERDASTTPCRDFSAQLRRVIIVSRRAWASPNREGRRDMSVIEEKQNKAAEERPWSYTVGIANGAVTTRRAPNTRSFLRKRRVMSNGYYRGETAVTTTSIR